MRPSRKSSSRSSKRWENAPSRTAPNNPARPFSVCTARKASLISDGSSLPAFCAASSDSRLRLSVSMISCASEKNSSRALSVISGMRSPLGLRGQEGPHLRDQRLGAERLDQVTARPQEQSPLAIALRRRGRDDQDRRRL